MMRRRRFLCASVTAAIAGGRVPACAATAPVALSGDRFSIGDVEHRLADVVAPSPDGAGGPAPHAERSRAMLEALLADGVDEIREASPPDRWGRRVVVASRQRRNGEKTSLQALLVAGGAARVRPETREDSRLTPLLRVEAQARAAGRGLWSLDAYRVWPSDGAVGAIGAFQLVEGPLRAASETRRRTYLNFGADYRTDFTATATPSRVRAWRSDGFDILSLEGARLRVRGFIERINGPSIEITHRRQIEVIGP